MDILISIAVLLWAAISTGPKYIWKKGAGCFFEFHALIRYVAILISGCYLAYKIYPPGLDEALAAQWPPLWVVIVVLIIWPIMLIYARRRRLIWEQKNRKDKDNV